MIKSKYAFPFAAFFVFCLLGSFDCFAQAVPRTHIEPSYEVVLQTVTGSATGAKTDFPQAFSGIMKKLKANYTYTNYRLISTSFQRVGNNGGVESKSVSNEAPANEMKNLSVFSEWTLSGLQNLPDAKGQNSVQFQSFRFGQRVPIVRSVQDESGKNNPVVTYESTGLFVQRFSLPIGVPTLIGSLPTAKSDETMFLILTVKSAEE